jgi:hypothetical protein
MASDIVGKGEKLKLEIRIRETCAGQIRVKALVYIYFDVPSCPDLSNHLKNGHRPVAWHVAAISGGNVSGVVRSEGE